MNIVKIGGHLLNLERVGWVEVVEGRPTVHLCGGGDFRPRTDEEAAALHHALTDNMSADEKTKVPAFSAWKR